MIFPRLILPVLSLFTIVPVGTAQTQLWSHQIGTPQSDRVLGLAPDGSGGFFAAGDTWGSLGAANNGQSDPWVGRFDAAGNPAWIQQPSFGFNFFEAAEFAAADGTGGVFIGGGRCDTTCFALRAWFSRYDGAGNVLWSSSLGGGSGSDGALAGAAAPGGGLFVGGNTENSPGAPNAGQQDAWFARYSATGNQIWIRQFGSSARDTVTGATPDGVGGVYFCGQLENNGAGAGRAWLARYDGNGNELWRVDYPVGILTSAAALCGDGAGGVYVGGFTAGSLGGQATIGGSDAFVARYDDAGNEQWIRLLGTTNGDQARAVAPNGSGGVYITGSTNAGSFGNFHDDVWLARYDAFGNGAWTADYATDLDDSAGGLAEDGSGGVFVGGATFGVIGGSNLGLEDAWLARHDEVLVSRFCSPANPNSTGEPAVIDAIGSNTTSVGDLTLIANQIPPGKFGMFIASQSTGMTTPPGGQGLLCLAGNIGRFNTQIFQGPTGIIQVDMGQMPVNPPIPVVPGSTWYLQCWYRDNNPGQTSNFTDALSITFD